MGIPGHVAPANGEAARLRWEWALGARGAGSVVTCIPGLFAGGWIWDDTWRRLRAEGLSALRLRDPLATLDAAREPVAESRRVLECLLDDLGVTGSIVCGNSPGALLALDLARLRPGHVRAVVLSGAPGLEDGVNLGIGTPRAATREFVNRLVDVLFYDRSGVTDDMIERTRAVLADKGRLFNVVRALRAARRDTPSLAPPAALPRRTRGSDSPRSSRIRVPRGRSHRAPLPPRRCHRPATPASRAGSGSPDATQAPVARPPARPRSGPA